MSDISPAATDKNGFRYFGLEMAERQKNKKAIIYKDPVRVIPVIFLPGVMGTNLMDSNGKSVWRMDDTLGTFASWGFRGAEKRKRVLDPNNTFVDPNGAVSLEFNNEVEKFSTRKSRGWGEIGNMSYGEFLPWLQKSLNDHDIKNENTRTKNGKKTLREQLITMDLNAELGEEESKNVDTDLTYKYLFPVEVFGYNWLESNEISAQRLEVKIKETVDKYNKRNMLCEKVILVTHSMGGFVARHYSENLGGCDNILGIVHGVMPTLGSPMTYKRMKAGEAGGVGLVIGSNGAQMTAVLAKAPGPLQLLPGIKYKKGWLQIEGLSSGLPDSDPFEAIYTKRDVWWNLCEDRFLNPGVEKIDKAVLDCNWDKYLDIIINTVKTFIINLDGKFHKNTYAFYGNDGNKYPSYARLYWKNYTVGFYDRNNHQNNVDIANRGIILDPYYTEINDVRTAYLVDSPDKTQWKKKTYIMAPPDAPGDGTVPVESAKFVSSGLKAMLGVGVDHEGAFKNTDTEYSRWFTLRSIIKIAQGVTETKLAYKK
ncbi:lipase family alpha/beta hydrolase [Cronobacter dublinensis]